MFFYWPALERGIPGVDWDFDELEGLEDLGVYRGEGDWGVSTLKINPVFNEPYVSLFRSESEAIMYARLRALQSGSPRRTEKGRVMFVLHYPLGHSAAHGVPQADIKYRVLRGERNFQGEQQDRIWVIRLAGSMPDGRPRWVLVKGLSVTVRDLEKEYEEARLSHGTQRLTRWDRGGDPETGAASRGESGLKRKRGS